MRIQEKYQHFCSEMAQEDAIEVQSSHCLVNNLFKQKLKESSCSNKDWPAYKHMKTIIFSQVP